MPIFRRHQLAPAQSAALESPIVKAKVREAYDRGRLEERRRHQGSPMLTFLLFVVAAVGAVTLYYSFRQGSFMGGGAAIDNRIAQVGSNAAPALQSAAEKAGALAKTARQELRSQGPSVQQSAASDSAAPSNASGR